MTRLPPLTIANPTKHTRHVFSPLPLLGARNKPESRQTMHGIAIGYFLREIHAQDIKTTLHARHTLQEASTSNPKHAARHTTFFLDPQTWGHETNPNDRKTNGGGTQSFSHETLNNNNNNDTRTSTVLRLNSFATEGMRPATERFSYSPDSKTRNKPK